MKGPLAFLLLTLTLFLSASAAEFPNLLSHIQLTWLGNDMTSKIDSSQTVSVNGSVNSFTFCGEFNTSSQMLCSSVFSYSVETGDRLISGSGKGNLSTTGFTSQTGQQYCLRFYNWIPSFKEVYNAAEIGQGTWKQTWSCERRTSGWTIFFWLMGILILLVIAGFAFWRYDQAYPEKTRPIKEWFHCIMTCLGDVCLK